MSTSYTTGQILVNGPVQGTSITDGTNVLSNKIEEDPTTYNFDMRLNNDIDSSFTFTLLVTKLGTNAVIASWKNTSFSWNGSVVTSGATYQSTAALDTKYRPKTNGIHRPFRLQRNSVWMWGDIDIVENGVIRLFVDVTNTTDWKYNASGTNSFVIDAGAITWNYEP